MYNLKIITNYCINQTETNCIWHFLHNKNNKPITTIRYVNDKLYGIRHDIFYK
jgi:hypothetical protein